MARTRAERLQMSFWNATDIGMIYGLPYKVAKRAYELADQLDNEELNDYRVYQTKVRATSVEKILGIKKAAIA